MPVSGGTITDAFPEVVGLVVGGHVACSGVLVAPRLVLTAAHCVGAEHVAAGGGADLRGATWMSPVFSWRHPRFDPVSHDDDVGLVVLERVAPTAPALIAAEIPAVGTTLTVVGFGHADAAGIDDHVRRSGTVELAAIDGDALVLAAAPSSACFGDSGGAVMWASPTGARLVGVVVAGDASCAGSTRALLVAPYADEVIVPLAAASAPGEIAAGDWCIDDASCASGTCWFPADAPARGYCAPACDDDGDCATGTCEAGRCLLPMPSPGAFGAACDLAIACETGRCAGTLEDEATRCTERCFADAGGEATCPSGAACVASLDPVVDVCVARTGGCATGSDGAALWAVLAMYAVIAWRRRTTKST